MIRDWFDWLGWVLVLAALALLWRLGAPRR